MKTLFLFALLATVTSALLNSDLGDCRVINPITNTIVTAGEKMKIMWADSHATEFPTISLIQLDGNKQPIILAKNVPTLPGKMEIELPRTLVPSNAYYLTLGEAAESCQSGNLRILGASSIIPDPKTPGTFEDQISSGRFPKSASSSSTLLPVLHITFTAIIIAVSSLISAA